MVRSFGFGETKTFVFVSDVCAKVSEVMRADFRAHSAGRSEHVVGNSDLNDN